VTWLVLWIGAALFTALPQMGEGGLDFMLSTADAEAPRPLQALDSAELRWLTVGHSDILGIALAVACLAVGFAVFLGVLPRLFLAVSMAIAVAGWVAVANLGGILTGSTSDVGTGPVLILLALAFWPAGGRTSPWLSRHQSTASTAAGPEPPREAQPAAGS